MSTDKFYCRSMYTTCVEGFPTEAERDAHENKWHRDYVEKCWNQREALRAAGVLKSTWTELHPNWKSLADCVKCGEPMYYNHECKPQTKLGPSPFICSVHHISYGEGSVCPECTKAADEVIALIQARVEATRKIEPAHVHDFSVLPPNDDEQQCDSNCRSNHHLCKVCNKSRATLANEVEVRDAVCNCGTRIHFTDAFRWEHVGTYSPWCKVEASPRTGLQQWKDVVEDALIVNGILTDANENDPQKALQDLISWEIMIALDPLVSEEARKLQESGNEEFKAIRFELQQCRNRVDQLETALLNIQHITGVMVGVELSSKRSAKNRAEKAMKAVDQQ